MEFGRHEYNYLVFDDLCRQFVGGASMGYKRM